jgi:hypothetical protein
VREIVFSCTRVAVSAHTAAVNLTRFRVHVTSFDATDDVSPRFDKPAAVGKDHLVLDVIIRTAQHKRKSTFGTVVPPITSSEGRLSPIQELATS